VSSAHAAWYAERLSRELFANPHSLSAASGRATAALDEARRRLLALLGVDESTHAVVFTANTSGALRLVGELFKWSASSRFAYLLEVHNSLLGVREYAAERGARLVPFRLPWPPPLPARLPSELEAEGAAEGEEATGLLLLAGLPLQCNFTGLRVPAVEYVRALRERGWHVLLDAAGSCAALELDLRACPADFVALSLAKLFGLPPLGALILRRDAEHLLRKHYFAGGTVLAVSVLERRHALQPELSRRLEDGTPPFLAAAALPWAFDRVARLGARRICLHARALALWTARQMRHLRHPSGARLVELYGYREDEREADDAEVHGPVVAFNLRREDGLYVPLAEVLALAGLHGIALRTGCFCNPGACLTWLGLEAEHIFEARERGAVCGLDTGRPSARPLGAVRVSFGYASTFEHARRLIRFLADCFLAHPPAPGPGLVSAPALVPSLSEMYLYPIKSCGAFAVREWPLGAAGLLYDREWALLDAEGRVLSLRREPRLALVRPEIDRAAGLLRLRAPAMPELGEACLVLDAAAAAAQDDYVVVESEVFGLEPDLRRYREAHPAVQWFRALLGRHEGVQLVRRVREPGREEALGFANESQLLLISEASLEALRARLGREGEALQARQFRPNLVVRGTPAWAEDTWQRLSIGPHRLRLYSPCSRCGMVNIDPETGRSHPASQPLRCLSTFRRGQQGILFGIHLSRDRSAPASSEPLSVGLPLVLLQ
jgi:molybdenum cofactor sulfurtransferase